MRYTDASDGYVLYRRAIHVAPDAPELVSTYAQITGAPIFNPDELRVRADIHGGECGGLREKLMNFLTHRRIITEHRQPGKCVAIFSYAGCAQQQMHTDYDTDKVKRTIYDASRRPLGVLLAIQDGTKLCTLDHGTPHMNAGDVLVFESCFVHAGAGYDTDNARVHVYLDSVSGCVPQNETWLIEDKQGDP